MLVMSQAANIFMVIIKILWLTDTHMYCGGLRSQIYSLCDVMGATGATGATGVELSYFPLEPRRSIAQIQS